MSFEFNSCIGMSSNYLLIQALSKRAFSPEQCRAIERLRNENDKLVIEKYIAGNTRYDMRMSNYGNKNVTVHTSNVWSKISFLSDTGSNLKKYLMTVDLQKKAELEHELEKLTKDIDDIIAKAQARKADDDIIRAKIEELTQRLVSLPLTWLI